MRIALAYRIEGCWIMCTLLLFIIGFNPSNVYALLYSFLTYDKSTIFSTLGLLDICISTALHICLECLRINTLSCIVYVCSLRFLFSSWLFLSIIVFYVLPISYKWVI